MADSNEPDAPEYLTAHTIRLSQNVTRVDSLIDLHGFLGPLAERAEDRRPEVDDVLRAATVLLHASLEDFVRSIAAEHLPKADAELLKNIPLAGTGNLRQTKYTLSDLVAHRGKQVDAIIDESIHQWLHQQSFNNCGDLVTMLKHIGINPEACKSSFASLEQMIARRHRIVHNADRVADPTGSDSSELLPISSDVVQKWRDAVVRFMKDVLYQLQTVVECE